jgi:hypothetical protein
MKNYFYYSAICLLAIIIVSCQKPKLSDEANNENPNSGGAFRTSSGSSILQWQKCFGSSGTDDAHSIATAIDAAYPGYFLVGTEGSTGGNVTVNHGGDDAWLVKTDLMGTLIWQLSIGGSSNDYGKGVVATDDGGCVVAIDGRSTDGDFGALGSSANGLVLVKVNNLGSIVWMQRYTPGVPHAMIKTSDGGVAITGYTWGPGAPDPQSSVWLLKLNPVAPVDGTEQPYQISLNTSFGISTGTHGETGYGITQTPNGGFAIVGATYSAVNSNPDIWVVGADAGGTQLWKYQLGGTAADVGWGITNSSNDNSVVFTGYMGLNLVVVKLDAVTGLPSTQTTSQTTYLGGKVSGLRGYAIISTADGYIVTGSTNGRAEIVNTNGGLDLIVVKLGLDLSKKTNYSLGGTGDERGRSIIPSVDVNGGYLALGYTSSNNGMVSGNNGAKDFWLVKLSSP